MSDQKSTRILVVEDEEEVLELVSHMLRGKGYEVEEAVNGQLALAKLQRSAKYDLVISDVRMPKMNGFELATKLLELPYPACRTQILFLSGINDIRFVEKARSLQFGYCLKPWQIDDLISRIEALLPLPVTEEELRDMLNRAKIPDPQAKSKLKFLRDASKFEAFPMTYKGNPICLTHTFTDASKNIGSLKFAELVLSVKIFEKKDNAWRLAWPSPRLYMEHSPNELDSLLAI